jgi:hypothetical protein
MKKYFFAVILVLPCIFFVSCKKDPPPVVSFEDHSTRFKATVTDSVGHKLKGAFIVLYDGLTNLTDLGVASDAKATNDAGEAIFSNLDATHTYYFVSYKGYDANYAYTVFYPNVDFTVLQVPMLEQSKVVEKAQVIKLVKTK